jgi:hypothetical protein
MASDKPQDGEAPAKASTEPGPHASADKQPTPPPNAIKAAVTRRIGLSLGADICWPICFEKIMANLQLSIPWNGAQVGIEVERVTIEPFSLAQPSAYDVVLDRLTHWYHPSREWIKKAILMNDLYVLNNPWAVQSMEKHTTYAAMMHLGMPVPETWMLPPKAYAPLADLQPTLRSYAQLFDLRAVGKRIGYPMFIKPYDGGGWKGVSHIGNENELLQRYEESGTAVMHLQKAVAPYDDFVRCVGVGPQTRLVRYAPDEALHNRYTMDSDFLPDDEAQILRDTTLTINAFFGWDFNSCEALRQDGIWHPIDFANPCPDSQVTSLHFHFPWLVIAKLKWAIFCAVTKRRYRKTLDWDAFYAIAAQQDMPYRDKLRAYAAVAAERFDTARFNEFCATHLAHLDEVAWDFFGTPVARDAIRQKVTALFPAHEIDRFTELFWNRVQHWRAHNVPAGRPA